MATDAASSAIEERRLRAQRRLAWLVAGLVLACAVASALVVALRPRQFTTHRDAIGFELASRDIAYQQIYLNRSWPDTLTDEYYGADLQVLLPSGRNAVGRLECKVRRTNCMFTVRTLGIFREPLPELVAEAEQPEWLRWAEQMAARLGIRG